MNKRISILAIIIVFALIFTAGCGLIRRKKIEHNPVATMEIKDWGTVTIELYPEVAPNTVNNFISLANSGFYDGLIFHRVIEEFMIQGGCPLGDGTGGPGYRIKGEFSNNGFKNNLLHEVGVVSMARSQDYDSAGSQFFIMVEDKPHLDGNYAAFGKVTEGMDIVLEISQVSTDERDRPWDDVVIEKITVDTFGYDYPKPKTKK